MNSSTQNINRSVQENSSREKVKENLQGYGNRYVTEPAKGVFGTLSDYAKNKPDVAAVWCFGLGVLVGWKLRS